MAHSDARERLYRAVSEVLPTTSIQSVHNILADLTTAGLIRRIEPAGSAALYERRIDDNHHHVVCTSCGAIGDVDCVVGEAPCLTPVLDGGIHRSDSRSHVLGPLPQLPERRTVAVRRSPILGWGCSSAPARECG